MAKGTLTLRDKALDVLSREEWAARFGGKPVADVLCTGTWCAAGPHVHPRYRSGGGLYPTFRVDPATGWWLSPDRDVA